jgi:hypothetical protein
MRRILRTAARSITVSLWIVKGLLLLMALATLVLWPMSRGKYLLAQGRKYTE